MVGSTATISVIPDLNGKTGLLYFEQTTNSLIEGVHKFESNYENYDIHTIRKDAVKFSKDRLQAEFKEFIEHVIQSHSLNNKRNTTHNLGIHKKTNIAQETK